jgi:hypothetical protein
LGENGDRQGGRLGDEQVVGLDLELEQFGVEVSADAAHGVVGEAALASIDEHRAAAFRNTRCACGATRYAGCGDGS